VSTFVFEQIRSEQDKAGLERRTNMPRIVLPIPDSIYHAAFQKTSSFIRKSVEDVLVDWLQDGYREELARETSEPPVAVLINRDEPRLHIKTA
jgi:hypothetical protein